MLTPDQIKELLNYDPQTGCLTWKVRTSRRVQVGKTAGCKSPDGRILVGIFGKLYKAHRVAWAIMTGEWPANQIDHKNQDPSDNRWDNLREATKAQNMRNITRIASNTSGVKGVGWSKAAQKWRAYIRVDGAHHHLGLFEDIEEAKKARKEAESHFYGEFAPH